MKPSWVGIDPGQKRIGVARSDLLGITAQPQGVVASVGDLLALLREWAAERELAGVLVGYPLNMDGSVGPIARRSLELVRRLRREQDLPVRLWDERLTTRQARQGPRPRSRGEIDARAAALLLQSFLDAGTPDRPDPPELAEPAGGE